MLQTFALPSHHRMLSLLSLLSQYEILLQTAKYLSALDLLHLGLANSDFHAIILRSVAVLDRLKLTTLCDGTGLKARQNFEGLYGLHKKDWKWWEYWRDHLPRRCYDEELEVRVWNTKCDETTRFPA
jgi:hypothetical protein